MKQDGTCVAGIHRTGRLYRLPPAQPEPAKQQLLSFTEQKFLLNIRPRWEKLAGISYEAKKRMRMR